MSTPPKTAVKGQTKVAGDASVSDEDLMTAFAKGDANAFETLVQRHQRGIFNFLYRSVHQRARAEELMQEVFLRVVRARDRYARTAKFTTWLYTIARNISVDEARRAVHRRTVSLDAPRGAVGSTDTRNLLDTTAAQQPGVDEAARGPHRQARIAQAIAALPVEQSEVFRLRQLQGLSFKEIAEIVGATENTVKSRMRYALEKIRQELHDLDPTRDGRSELREHTSTKFHSNRKLAPQGAQRDG